MMGPAVGGGLLLLVGACIAILINVLIYIPLIWWLWKAPYGPRFRDAGIAPPTRRLTGFADFFETMRQVAGKRVLVSMIMLAGTASLLVGNAHQAQMPEFARDLGHGNASVYYSILLAANAAGALIAGIVLESRGLLPARPTTAFVLAAMWCVAIVGFAATNVYPFAVALLFVAGFLNLAYGSMAQTLVQLNAPDEIRGRVIGLYNTSGNGLKAFSGVTVGIAGSVIGIHWSLGLSAALLMLAIIALMVYAMRANLARSAAE
jgi:MFS family permease